MNYSINYFFKRQQENYLKIQTELIQTQFQTQYKYLKIMSHDIYSMYQDNQKLISLFEKTTNASKEEQALIRNKMYNMLKKRYKRLVNMGVKQLHFHLKDNTSFLRMHAPNKFGDNLQSIRKSVATTNREIRPTEGFEVGKVHHGFRYVYPLFSNANEHIGSIEISFSSKQLIEYITDKFIIDKHFIILKSEIESKMYTKFKNDLYDNSVESPSYCVEKGSSLKLKNREFHKIIKDSNDNELISQKMHDGKPFSTSSSYNYNAIVITFIPINSALEKRNIAYLVLYSESDYIDSLVVEREYVKILLASIISLLFLFSIYVSVTQHRLKQMAHFDKLTSLPNRAYFYIGLEREVKRAKRSKKTLALMFIDLDGFKNINDTYGHDSGDKLLVETAYRLQKSVRTMDLVARIGGDEFIVLLTDVTQISNASDIAQNIINRLNQDFKINNHILNIGASIGISFYPQDADNIDTLISNADSAMYVAKNSGKNNFSIHKKINT